MNKRLWLSLIAVLLIVINLTYLPKNESSLNLINNNSEFLSTNTTTYKSQPEPFSFSMLGDASWYSKTDRGVLPTTANMEKFDDKKFTCAIWGIPFHSRIKVTNRENGKSIIVRVNDRGPAKRLTHKGRVIDLSKEAFSKIADLDKGLVNVQVTIFPVEK